MLLHSLIIYNNVARIFATVDQTLVTTTELLVEHTISRHRVPSEFLSNQARLFIEIYTGWLQNNGNP